MRFIQAQGTGDQQNTLAKLLLLKPRFDDKLPFASIPTLSGHFIAVPTLLREHFAPAAPSLLRWLPHSLRWDRQLQEECFGMETTYQIIALNQQLQRIEQQLTLPKERSGMCFRFTESSSKTKVKINNAKYPFFKGNESYLTAIGDFTVATKTSYCI